LTRPTVLVVGSLHYDIMVETDHLPRRDETAVGTRWYPKFGGKGGNQAVSCAGQGAAVRFLGAVGNDDFGRFLMAGLADGQVQTGFVQRVANAGSGMSVALQDQAGDYAATIVSGANLLIDPAVLADDGIWNGVGLLILQNEVPEAVNLAAASHARRRGIRTVLNAAPYRPMSDAFASMIDILVVNAVEAEMMGAAPVCCLASASEAARKLASRFDCVIVTAGSRGLALWAPDDSSMQIAAEKVDVVSSHGAGDAFVGALAAALCLGVSILDACHTASIAAARHVSCKSDEGDSGRHQVPHSGTGRMAADPLPR
jgi:ribokinase